MLVYRKALTTDIPAIFNLVSDQAQQKNLLERSKADLRKHVDEFMVAIDDDRLAGIGALHQVKAGFAEIRSLAVAPSFVGKGIGRDVVELLMRNAGLQNIAVVFALTHQPEFFQKAGFLPIPKRSLPPSWWGRCVKCGEYHLCDESAVIRYLPPPYQSVTRPSDEIFIDSPMQLENLSCN